MPKVVEHKGKIQVWKDPQDVVHLVFYRNEPFQLGCKPKVGMWGYYPKFSDIIEVNCNICLSLIK